MQLDIRNAQVEPDEVALHVETLEPYIQKLKEVAEAVDFTSPEASINLPSDLTQREVISALHQEIENVELKYIFLIGIGGSNLGTKAVYDALYGYADTIKENREPKIIFVDTNDTTLLQSALHVVKNQISSINEVLLISISKSGGTTETIVNTEIVLKGLLDKFGDESYERVVGITGEGSVFEKELKSKGIRILHIPEKVGGRFSVFSPVGLFPLLAAHIDIDELLSGALDMRNRCLDDTFSKNTAMQSAIAIYLANRRGQRINTNFVFHPELESLGKWYRQLLAESTGKKENRKGDTVYAGITPEVSVGSTDLHSMAQLYLGGPNDKITTFINSTNDEDDIDISDRIFNLIPEVTKKTNKEVMDAIYNGVKAAYEKSGRPFIEISFEDLSLYEIGAFMQFKMMEVMFLAELLNIDAFNQPSVEEYKVETKRILKEK